MPIATRQPGQPEFVPTPKPDIARAFRANERAIRDLHQLAAGSAAISEFTRKQALVPKLIETSAIFNTQKLAASAITASMPKLIDTSALLETQKLAASAITASMPKLIDTSALLETQKLAASAITASMPKLIDTSALLNTQKLAASAITASMPKLIETSAIFNTQKLMRGALSSISASRLIEAQLRELVRSPIAGLVASDFGALRRQIEISTRPLPPLVVAADVDVAVEIGIREARTLRERWRELPGHTQSQLEVYLLVLIAEVGTVVSDFVPSEHATRFLHLVAAAAALHAVLTSWDDGGGGPRG